MRTQQYKTQQRGVMTVDVMRPEGKHAEKFVATLTYRYNPLFRFDTADMYRFIVDKRPSLKGKTFNVYTDDEVVPVIHFYEYNPQTVMAWS